jgi:hypothetical protein
MIFLRPFRVQQAPAINTIRNLGGSRSILFPSFKMTATTAKSVQAAFATIDLSGYDAEQSRLMDERCIIVDEQDNAIGALDKKTCTCFYCTLSRSVLSKHQQATSWRTSGRVSYIAHSPHLSSVLPTASSCCSSVRRRRSHSLICGQTRVAHTHSTTLRKKR